MRPTARTMAAPTAAALRMAIRHSWLDTLGWAEYSCRVRPTGKSSRGLAGALITTALVPTAVVLFFIGLSGASSLPEGGSIAVPTAVGLDATATHTPRPTNTATPTPTVTPTASDTPTPTPTLTPSVTPTPTPRPRPVPDGVQRTARVPILMYHYISAPPDRSDRLRVDLSVLPENLDAQLQWLAENGYHTITLTDLYYHLAVGEPLPDNPIILTFDDGYVDHYTNAFPILQKHGFVGTFFILSGPADVASPRYLTWDMIAEMGAAGMDIEAHGRTHVDMRRRKDDFLYYQIVGARQGIEAHTGKPAPFYAYPAGQYDANVLRFLETRDFWMAVTTRYGRTHSLNSALELTRVRIRGTDGLKSFIAKVTSDK